MKTAHQALSDIRTSVEAIQSDATHRFPIAASDGDTHRQGDLYIIFREQLPEKLKLDQFPSIQLVPGQSKGSQHKLDSLEGVTLYRRVIGDDVDGPVMQLTKERTVMHPEHGDVILPPGIYQIRYQRVYTVGGKSVRVKD